MRLIVLILMILAPTFAAAQPAAPGPAFTGVRPPPATLAIPARRPYQPLAQPALPPYRLAPQSAPGATVYVPPPPSESGPVIGGTPLRTMEGARLEAPAPTNPWMVQPRAPVVTRDAPPAPWEATTQALINGPCPGGCRAGRIGQGAPIPSPSGAPWQSQATQCVGPGCGAVITVTRGPRASQATDVNGEGTQQGRAPRGERELRLQSVADAARALNSPPSVRLRETPERAYGVPISPGPIRLGPDDTLAEPRTLTVHGREWTYRQHPVQPPAPGARLDLAGQARGATIYPSNGQTAVRTPQYGRPAPGEPPSAVGWPTDPAPIAPDGLPGVYGATPGRRGEGRGLPAPLSQAAARDAHQSAVRPFSPQEFGGVREPPAPAVPAVPAFRAWGRQGVPTERELALREYVPAPRMPLRPGGVRAPGDGHAHRIAPNMTLRSAGGFAGQTNCTECGQRIWIRNAQVVHGPQTEPLRPSPPAIPRREPPSLGQAPATPDPNHPDTLWRTPRRPVSGALDE